MTEQPRGTVLSDFFDAVQNLRQVNVLRSDKYLGDIGEFIASTIFTVELSNNQREETIDGEINGSTVQVKFNSSPTKTNINVGRARDYDLLVLILSRSSKHFPLSCNSDFVGYLINQDSILTNFSETANDTFSCTRSILEAFTYREINFDDLN